MSLNQIKIYRPGVIQLALNLLTFVYLHTLTITAIKKFTSNGICKIPNGICKFRFCKKNGTEVVSEDGDSSLGCVWVCCLKMQQKKMHF